MVYSSRSSRCRASTARRQYVSSSLHRIAWKNNAFPRAKLARHLRYAVLDVGVNGCRTTRISGREHGPPGRRTRFAIEDPDFDPLNPTPFLLFFHLPIGQSLGPAQDGTPRPTAGALRRGRIPTSKGFYEG